jgi:methionyl-tRNA formyltransferase
MRIYVLTQEDAFYLPRMLDHVLAERRDVIGIGIVPGEMQPGSLKRYWTMMGPRDFLLTGVRLAAYRALAAAGRLVRLPQSYSVTGAARRHEVPFEHVPNVNANAFVESLRARDVELLVSIACPQIIRNDLLRVPPRGAINIHGALLPRYQGLLPSFWVLAEGERETGVTVHWMDEQVDHGAILLQQPVPIERRDTVHSLVRRSKVEIGKHLLVEAITAIERGDAPRVLMDHAKATYFSYPDESALRRFRARARRFI